MTATTDSGSLDRWTTLGEWGTQARMNELEALMWRGERHPEFSSTGVVLELLDSVPDWERFRKAHAWGVDAVPRLRQRVVEPLLPFGPPAWADDPHFDLDYHVRRIRLPEPCGMRELLEAAQVIGETPLDRSRALWTGTLVENLENGRAAYILQSHHCLMDGAAAIQLFGGMHSRTRRSVLDKPVKDAPQIGIPEPVSLTAGDIAAQVRGVPGGLIGAVSAARRALSSPSELVEFAGSVRRVLSVPPGATPSPLIERQMGKAWRYGLLECSLTELKSAGRAAGGSVNDAYMAALLGGLRRYHEALNISLGDIPVAMPVSIRRPGDPVGGNRFAGAIFAGPAGNPDPAERIAGIRGAVLSVRAEPALDVLGALAPILSRTPGPLLGLALGAMPRVDLSGSNIPGLTDSAYVAGTKVERMYVFGPLPNASMLSSMISYVGTCCIGINCDGAVFADTDLLWASMREGLDEVLDLARPARRAPRKARRQARPTPSRRSGATT